MFRSSPSAPFSPPLTEDKARRMGPRIAALSPSSSNTADSPTQLQTVEWRPPWPCPLPPPPPPTSFPWHGHSRQQATPVAHSMTFSPSDHLGAPPAHDHLGQERLLASGRAPTAARGRCGGGHPAGRVASKRGEMAPSRRLQRQQRGSGGRCGRSDSGGSGWRQRRCRHRHRRANARPPVREKRMPGMCGRAWENEYSTTRPRTTDPSVMEASTAPSLAVQ